jgi:hypothetical protein
MCLHSLDAAAGFALVRPLDTGEDYGVRHLDAALDPSGAGERAQSTP